MSVLDILLQKKLITKSDIGDIRKQVSAGSNIEEALLSRGVQPEDIISARGEFLNIPVRSVADGSVPYEVLDYIPQESAMHYKFVPLRIMDGILEVGLVDPDNMEARDALNFLAAKKNIPYKIFLITFDDFHKVLEMYTGSVVEVNKAVADLQSDVSNDSSNDSDQFSNSSATDKTNKGEKVIVEDAPVIKIMQNIIRMAVDSDSSDVHIERTMSQVRVRFRTDGVLHSTYTLPANIHDRIVSYIKIKSNLRIDERRRPQDGRFTYHEVLDRPIDLRISTFPTYHGEKVVLRILDRARGVRKINELDLSDRNLKMLRDAINRPYGLILLTGPTGSGKTSTLYSILNEIDRESLNVVSLEDPVEYMIDGVNQSQMKPEIGYSFDTGLRTTLRQDPDVIMVGEIRDKETAKLAVQSALTGHLVLSTLHTNNAAGVIPRLIDMGVDPYLIAPTLVLAAAQRLAGALVKEAGEAVPVQGSIKGLIDSSFSDLPEQYKKEIPFTDTVYRIKRDSSVPRGTRGRLAVFEMFMMDKDIEQAILNNPVESEIHRIARSKGMLTLQEDAIVKAFQGKIPFEEVNKLTGWGDDMLE